MKKVFFAFVAATVVVLSACNSKPAESTETTTVDSAATAPVEEAVEAVAPADSTAAPADSTAAPAN